MRFPRRFFSRFLSSSPTRGSTLFHSNDARELINYRAGAKRLSAGYPYCSDLLFEYYKISEKTLWRKIKTTEIIDCRTIYTYFYTLHVICNMYIIRINASLLKCYPRIVCACLIFNKLPQVYTELAIYQLYMLTNAYIPNLNSIIKYRTYRDIKWELILNI